MDIKNTKELDIDCDHKWGVVITLDIMPSVCSVQCKKCDGWKTWRENVEGITIGTS